MLTPHNDIFCGIFDSSIARKGIVHSSDRLVECFELEIFHRNSGTSYINEIKHPVKRGMLILAKPGQIRHSEFPVRCSYIRIFPSEHIDSKLIALLNTIPDCTYLDSETKISDLLALFARLGACFLSLSDNDCDKILINSLFYDILHKFLRASRKITDEENSIALNRIAREACNYINENYMNDCSLKTIAHAVSASPNYLQTIFTKSIGISPYEYVIEKRIERAQKLIMTGEITMLEIALETGFRSQSHFCKIFKEKLGETPGEYRKRLFSDF